MEPSQPVVEGSKEIICRNSIIFQFLADFQYIIFSWTKLCAQLQPSARHKQNDNPVSQPFLCVRTFNLRQILFVNLITVETDWCCQTNVTLYCDVVSGNPRQLLQVKWFMDGLLLNELPQCGGRAEDLCDVDPSKLLLESVNRHFSGNFSCSGASRAGGSEMSAKTALTVSQSDNLNC